MAIDLKKLAKSKAVGAPRLLLFGTEGIGKSTFAASVPGTVYQPVEDIGPLEVSALPFGNSYQGVLDNLAEVYQQEHDFQAYALDSLSALERLIWDRVAADNKKDSIEGLGFGKGYVMALDYWRQLLQGLDAIRNERGMTIVLIAHSEVERFDSPTSEPYHQYRPALHKLASQLLRQWCDACLFANYRTFVREEDQGFNKKHRRGVGTGERILHTSERPAYLAKNRYSLPDEMPFTWTDLDQAIQAALRPSQSTPKQTKAA